MPHISATEQPRAPELERRRWRVLVVASVGVFMATLDSSIVAVALPVIGPRLRLTYSEALWVQAAYILVVAVLIITAGRLADLHGPLRLYTLGVILFGLFSVMAALSPGGLFLVMARGLQGVGGALLLATSAAIVIAAFPPEERGRALGFNVMFATIGPILGPPLGGLIATHLGWRWIFLVNVPVALATLGAGWDLLGAERRDRAAERLRRGLSATSDRVDALGAGLLGAMLATLFVPLSFSPLWGWANAGTIALLSCAVVLATAFVIVENRVKDPVLDLDLFRRNPVFAAGSTAALLFTFATYGIVIFTALFLEIVRGHSAQWAGLVLLVQPAVMTVLAPFAGRLSDRVGSRGPAAAGMVVVAAGLAQLALASSAASMWRLGAALATVGVGGAFFIAPNISAVMGSVDRSTLGVASGVRFTMGFSGQGLSISVLGAIAASQLGPNGGRVILLGESASAGNALAFAAGSREAMLVASGLALLGALVSLAAKSRRESRNSGNLEVIALP